jgi:hypothetical protein
VASLLMCSMLITQQHCHTNVTLHMIAKMHMAVVCQEQGCLAESVRIIPQSHWIWHCLERLTSLKRRMAGCGVSPWGDP